MSQPNWNHGQSCVCPACTQHPRSPPDASTGTTNYPYEGGGSQMPWTGQGGAGRDPGGYYPPLPKTKGADISDFLIQTFKQEANVFTIEQVENGYVVKKEGKTYVCHTTGLSTLLESLLTKKS